MISHLHISISRLIPYVMRRQVTSPVDQVDCVMGSNVHVHCLYCAKRCVAFSQVPPPVIGRRQHLETSLRVQMLALADTCQLFGSQEVQLHFLFCSKGDPHNQPSILEDIL